MRNRKEKSIKDISDKRIDSFSSNINKKAKSIKKNDGVNTEKKYKNGVCMPMITSFIDKMHNHYGKNMDYIDWEEVVCEIMVKYYEQQENMEGK